MCAVNAVHQLDRAALEYTQIRNYHKSYKATSVLQHTAYYHLSQVRALRSTDTTIDLRTGAAQMRMLHTHIRLAIDQVQFTKMYCHCGIDQA